MGRLFGILLLTLALYVCANAQSDWDTYQSRTIGEIIEAHTNEGSNKVDLIVSADPFPSKMVVTFTGRHRPVGEYTRDFIALWIQTRNVPASNAELLVEEYLFSEKGKEYWIPVVKAVTPFIEKELKSGDEIVVYYFFLGGYNEKRLRAKKKDKSKRTDGKKIEDGVTWIFAVEEFRRTGPGASSAITRPPAD